MRFAWVTCRLDPTTAMKVANRLATAFIDESLTDRTSLADNTTNFLAAQLEQAKGGLAELEKKLADYKMKHAGELPTERDSNMQAINNLQMQIQAVTDSISRDEDRRFLLERTIADLSVPQSVVPNVTISSDDPTMVAGGSTAAQLDAARAQLRILETRYKPDQSGHRAHEARDPRPRGEAAGRCARSARSPPGRAASRRRPRKPGRRRASRSAARTRSR